MWLKKTKNNLNGKISIRQRESFLFCFLVGYSNKRKGQFGNLGQTNWRHFQRAARSLSSFGSCLSIMYPRLTLPASLTCQLGQERESVGEVEPGSLSGSIEPIWFGLLPIYIYGPREKKGRTRRERERDFRCSCRRRPLAERMVESSGSVCLDVERISFGGKVRASWSIGILSSLLILWIFSLVRVFYAFGFIVVLF